MPRERRLDGLLEDLAELCGRHHAIAGRIAEILAIVDGEHFLGGIGCRSLEHFATWQPGAGSGRARNLCAIARRRDDLPTTVRVCELTCDATVERGFERDGTPIGAGRTTRDEHPLGARIDWKWYDPPSIN